MHELSTAGSLHGQVLIAKKYEQHALTLRMYHAPKLTEAQEQQMADAVHTRTYEQSALFSSLPIAASTEHTEHIRHSVHISQHACSPLADSIGAEDFKQNISKCNACSK